MRSRGDHQSTGGPDGTATFSTTDKDMVKKLSYFTLTLFIFAVGATSGTSAYAATAASSIGTVAGHIGTSFPESGSLALLGSILIFGATLLRKKLAAHAK
jgi:hypothetical protein